MNSRLPEEKVILKRLSSYSFLKEEREKKKEREEKNKEEKDEEEEEETAAANLQQTQCSLQLHCSARITEGYCSITGAFCLCQVRTVMSNRRSE